MTFNIDKKYVKTFLMILALLFNSCAFDFTIGTWKDGIIPYYLSGDFSDQDIENIYFAMESWESVCGVRFDRVKPRSSAYEIKRVNEAQWFSTIGENCSTCYMLFGKKYSDTDVIIHELGHCLGLLHEHQRPDRDEYVTIVWENILSGKEFNFEMQDNPLYIEQEFQYDYQSIMHYPPVSFSIDGSETIIAIDGNEITDAVGVTEIDAMKVRAIYGPPFTDDY